MWCRESQTGYTGKKSLTSCSDVGKEYSIGGAAGGYEGVGAVDMDSQCQPAMRCQNGTVARELLMVTPLLYSWRETTTHRFLYMSNERRFADLDKVRFRYFLASFVFW